MADAPWREKAKRIIAALSKQSYERENRLPNGKLRKKHRPYSIPETAEKLLKTLDTNDEETAKAIFLYDYAAQKVDKEET